VKRESGTTDIVISKELRIDYDNDDDGNEKIMNIDKNAEYYVKLLKTYAQPSIPLLRVDNYYSLCYEKRQICLLSFDVDLNVAKRRIKGVLSSINTDIIQPVVMSPNDQSEFYKYFTKYLNYAYTPKILLIHPSKHRFIIYNGSTEQDTASIQSIIEWINTYSNPVEGKRWINALTLAQSMNTGLPYLQRQSSSLSFFSSSTPSSPAALMRSLVGWIIDNLSTVAPLFFVTLYILQHSAYIRFD